jgi:Ca2+-binding EF-hand superfamily protein
MKRSKRTAIRNAQAHYAQKILETFDVSKTGTLSREEVHAMCLSIVEEVAPKVGVLESDIDVIMRVGGETAHAEITVEEIPAALSAVLALKSENLFIHELFVKYDTDNSGNLPKDQLSNLITELNEGIIPNDNDLDFIIRQCDISGDGAIEEAQIKAAIMGWYCLAEETPMPASIEEAKSSGYTDEQIEEFLKEAKEAGFNDDQIAEFMQKKGIAASERESVIAATAAKDAAAAAAAAEAEGAAEAEAAAETEEAAPVEAEATEEAEAPVEAEEAEPTAEADA